MPSCPRQVVRSEDSTAACGELPTSSYAGGAFSGLWQHGEARHILYSDEHSSVTNEVCGGGGGGRGRGRVVCAGQGLGAVALPPGEAGGKG